MVNDRIHSHRAIASTRCANAARWVDAADETGEPTRREAGSALATPRHPPGAKAVASAAALKPRTAGFTLIELLVVLAIVATLLVLSLPRYSQSVDVARERVLVENLRTTRDAIDKFYADTGRYPESLDEMVEKRYLRLLPIDPVLESDKSWRIVPPPAEKKGQVADLRSTAPGQTLDGKPFEDL